MECKKIQSENCTPGLQEITWTSSVCWDLLWAEPHLSLASAEWNPPDAPWGRKPLWAAAEGTEILLPRGHCVPSELFFWEKFCQKFLSGGPALRLPCNLCPFSFLSQSLSLGREGQSITCELRLFPCTSCQAEPFCRVSSFQRIPSVLMEYREPWSLTVVFQSLDAKAASQSWVI